MVVCFLCLPPKIIDFVYTLASANIDQSVPNFATIYMPLRSWMWLIMGQIELEHLELFALEFEKKMPNMALLTLYHLQLLTNQHQTWSKCM